MRGRLIVLALLGPLLWANPAGALMPHHRARDLRRKHPAPQCPIGVPTRTLTVINEAGAIASNLALVERAATDQSLQVRAAWGSPCLKFGPGGVPLNLNTGCSANTCFTSGVHLPNAITVSTGMLPASMWARAFTHETDEWAVDPSGHGQITTASGATASLEVCDPVENLTYPLDGVQVSDFALPSYFKGGSGPWDRMGQLTGPIY